MSNSFEDFIKTLSPQQKVSLLTALFKSLVSEKQEPDNELLKRIETLEKRLTNVEEKYEALIKLLAEISILKEQIRALESAIASITSEQANAHKQVTQSKQASSTLVQIEKKESDTSDQAESLIKSKKENLISSQEVNTPPNTAREMSNILATDLWKSIGFNERFAFIKELFGGDADQFTNTINTLNQTNNIKEAKRLLKSLHSQYNWDEVDEDVVEMFYEVVETKFGTSLR